MITRRASVSDFDRLNAFYDAVIDQQRFDQYGPDWTKGVYPSEDDIRSHLEKGEFLLVCQGDMIAAAAVLSIGEEEMYKAGGWSRKVPDEEVAVVHLLAIAPPLRGKGVSRVLMEYLLEEARKQARVIHLDVVCGNLPALRLYQRHGFTSAGQLEVYYEDTGNIVVELLERDLEKPGEESL
ncbi:MAG: GNAT family N-acetyltransferase [Erysipelotrichaceae bacterium]|nr:GNAT family N-acetyltransferase [Erysipelotrichaceae bacterium]